MDAHRRLADSSGEHMTQFLSVVWVFLFVGVVYFLYATADRRLVPLHTIVLVGLGAFSMVAILTRLDARVDSFERHSKVLRKMYVDVYWICFAMSLAGLPYAEEYDASGHVAALGKLLDSGRRMAVMWLAMGLGGLLFLGLVLGSGEVESADAFNVTLIACSNTANSLVLVLLLGVGAVELPKALFGAPPSRERLALALPGKPILLKCAAVCAAVASACLLVSQIGAATANTSAALDCSAFAVMARSGARRNGDSGAAAASLLCLTYMVGVCGTAMGLVKLRGFLDVNTSKKTPPKVLCFATRNCGKLAAPLLYNYLATLHEVGSSAAPPPLHDDDARRDMRLAFDRFYSAKMDAVTPHFDRVAASLVVVVALLHAGNMLNRLLVVAKLPGYQFGADLAAVDAGAVREGRGRLDRDRKPPEQLQAASDAVRELASPGVETARLRDERLPDERRGWLSKKAPEHLLAGVSTGWSKRYFCLRAPGELAYFKHEGDDEPVGVVDLRLVVGVGGAVDDDDAARFDLELADRSMKLKACDGDAASWIAALHAWRDRAVSATASRVCWPSTPRTRRRPRRRRSRARWRSRSPTSSAPTPGPAATSWWTGPGELALFYSAADAKAPGKRPYLAFDLRVCGAFAKHDKGAKSDPARFSVDVGDHSVKLKAPTAQDADAWVAGLRKWQDHILLGTAASMV
ncbi:LMBR1-like membrane protein [Aureococcus anophagefferens]|nr:LMBR1-like membrane protein [Aureococcus anophagefferens]